MGPSWSSASPVVRILRVDAGVRLLYGLCWYMVWFVVVFCMLMEMFEFLSWGSFRNCLICVWVLFLGVVCDMRFVVMRWVMIINIWYFIFFGCVVFFIYLLFVVWVLGTIVWLLETIVWLLETIVWLLETFV